MVSCLMGDSTALASAIVRCCLNSINTLRLMVPPKEQQGLFINFVEQTDKSKLTIQQSLDKLETLKKALMQRYFG